LSSVVETPQAFSDIEKPEPALSTAPDR